MPLLITRDEAARVLLSDELRLLLEVMIDAEVEAPAEPVGRHPARSASAQVGIRATSSTRTARV
jgi:hypothetical protein